MSELIKIIELFAGIGAFRKALIRQNIKHEVIGISEIDKYAVKSYNAIYGDAHNFLYGSNRRYRNIKRGKNGNRLYIKKQHQYICI